MSAVLAVPPTPVKIVGLASAAAAHANTAHVTSAGIVPRRVVARPSLRLSMGAAVAKANSLPKAVGTEQI
jgi:hypothetical protein